MFPREMGAITLCGGEECFLLGMLMINKKHLIPDGVSPSEIMSWQRKIWKKTEVFCGNVGGHSPPLQLQACIVSRTCLWQCIFS